MTETLTQKVVPHTAVSAENLKHDLPLLDLMMSDMKEAPDFWTPTPYWKSHESKTLAWLKSIDLNEFRNQYSEGDGAFGASFYGALPRALATHLRVSGRFGKLGSWMNRLAKYAPGFAYVNPQNVCQLTKKLEKAQKMLGDLTRYCAQVLDDHRDLDRVSDSGLGHPSDMIVSEGKRYTCVFLKYFSQYLFAKKYIDFSSVQKVLEIGPGYGGQAELFLKLFPDLKICLVDIPPQLYVTQQYLKGCFPGAVCGYRETRDCGKIDIRILEKYRIVILAPWQLDKIQSVNLELFWNSASFQEMEPDVVERYAAHVERLVNPWIYLRNQREGSPIIPGRSQNVTEQTRLEHYVRFFKDFELMAREPAKIIPNVATSNRYDHMIFNRHGTQGLRK